MIAISIYSMNWERRTGEGHSSRVDVDCCLRPGTGTRRGDKCNGCGCGEQPMILLRKDSPLLLGDAREGAAAEKNLFKGC